MVRKTETNQSEKAVRTYSVELEGLAPGILFNREVPGKDKPTVEDKLHLDGENRPCVDSEMIRQMLIDSAALSGVKVKGIKTVVKAALFFDPDMVPVAPEIWEEFTSMVHKKGGKDSGQSVETVRPLFKEGWQIGFRIVSADKELQGEKLRSLLVFAGHYKGLGSWRPKFGRFTVKAFVEEA